MTEKYRAPSGEIKKNKKKPSWTPSYKINILT